jgi:hypothetical protein
MVLREIVQVDYMSYIHVGMLLLGRSVDRQSFIRRDVAPTFPTARRGTHRGGPQSAAEVAADTGQHLIDLSAMVLREIVQVNDMSSIHTGMLLSVRAVGK